MSLRLEMQKLTANVLVGENTAQTVIEGSITVPESEPAIGKALLAKATPHLVQTNVGEDQISVEGVLDVAFYYASITETEVPGELEEDAPAIILEERLEKGTFKGAFPFSFVLDVPGARSGMSAQARAVVENTSFEVHGDQRTVDIDTVVVFTASVSGSQELGFSNRAIASADVELQQQRVRITSVPAAGKCRVKMEGILPFGGKELPGKVLDLDFWAAAPPTVKLENGIAHVNAPLSCTLLYTAAELGPAQSEWANAASCQADVALPGVSTQAEVDVAVAPHTTLWRVVDNGTDRGLAYEITVDMQVQAYDVWQPEIITTLYGTGTTNVAARRCGLVVQESIGENSTRMATENLLELPAGAAPVERVLSSAARVQVENVQVLGDKVAIEGTASFDMLYIGRAGEATSLSVASWPAGISLELEVPLTGAEPGLERRVEVSVENVQVDLINREMVEVTLELATKVRLWRTVDLDVVVEAVEVPPLAPNPPSYTFVSIHEGDTLWKLAQRYHTDVTSILAANSSLESEEAPLPKGGKVCIPKAKQSVA